MNYLLTERALPLLEHDLFTAQQAASIKPVFGKSVYDVFIRCNPFVRERFPNFDPSKHRSVYPEIQSSKLKRILETVLRCGPIQVLERLSRMILRRHLEAKATRAADVIFDARRLKLHMNSHKSDVLARSEPDVWAGNSFPKFKKGRAEGTTAVINIAKGR